MVTTIQSPHADRCSLSARMPSIPSNRRRQGIQQLRWLTLGGVRQAIHIAGEDLDLPVLLFLHGGPGLPHMPFAHVNQELMESFIVVNWDQRGAGKSYSPRLQGSELTIAQMESDTCELIDWLCDFLHKTSVILVGHSWGSLLGLTIAARYPSRVHAYVGIGQVTNLRAAERLRFEIATRLARETRNATACRSLDELGAPPYRSEQQSELLENWSCRLCGDCAQPLKTAHFFQTALNSPLYSWLDLLRIPLGACCSQRWLWPQVFETANLACTVPRLEIPVLFLTGRRDVVTNHALASQYFQALQAPAGKRFVTFDAGHWPHLEQPALFRSALLQGLGASPRGAIAPSRGPATQFNEASSLLNAA